jgi:serine/threonine protein kinase
VVAALEWIHLKGYVVRDLKPENVLLSGEYNEYKAIPTSRIVSDTNDVRSFYRDALGVIPAEGHVRLCDFGLCKPASQSDEETEDSCNLVECDGEWLVDTSYVTRSNTVCGTAEYLAPEARSASSDRAKQQTSSAYNRIRL